MRLLHDTHEIALRSHTLDVKHADPADRFIAATAAVLDLTLVTADKRLFESKQLALMANRWKTRDSAGVVESTSV